MRHQRRVLEVLWRDLSSASCELASWYACILDIVSEFRHTDLRFSGIPGMFLLYKIHSNIILYVSIGKFECYMGREQKLVRYIYIIL